MNDKLRRVVPGDWKRGPSPTKTDCSRCEKTIEKGDPVAARDTGRRIEYVCQSCDAKSGKDS